MRGKKDNLDAKDDFKEMNTDLPQNGTDVDNDGTDIKDTETEALEKELKAVKAELEEKSKKSEEYLNMLQRTAAEFDNFKKRTAREKDALYSEAVSDVAASILPVVDNLERAVQACSKEEDFKVLKEGIELVYRQFREAIKSVGIEEIKCLNENFDPQLHNAVMHMEDEAFGNNTVVEEFQKGYIYKDKVIRHSMVKVAN